MVPPAFTAAAASKSCNGRTRLLYDSCLSLQERRFPVRERRRGFTAPRHRLPPGGDSLVELLWLLISAHVNLQRVIFRPIIQSQLVKSRNRAFTFHFHRDTARHTRFHRIESPSVRIDILAIYIYPLEVDDGTIASRMSVSSLGFTETTSVSRSERKERQTLGDFCFDLDTFARKGHRNGHLPEVP